jgi:hypothetical protein
LTNDIKQSIITEDFCKCLEVDHETDFC